ncbi:MAG: hypothetical protein ACYC6Q_10690 [Syntrophales bacterium]
MRNGNFTSAFIWMPVILAIFSGCATDHPKEVYRSYYGPESSLAELDMGTACEVFIDDMHYVSAAKYRSVALAAGVHRIRWAVVFGVSVMVDPSGYARYEALSDVNFEAGHQYKLSADRTTGQGYRVFFWIEDMTTGGVVYGAKKP